MRSVLLVFAALAFVPFVALPATLTAQRCPDPIAVFQPPSITNDGTLDRSGGTRFSAIRIGNRDACPALIISTPGHHQSQYSTDSGTYTGDVSTASTRHYTHECAAKWFPFIPIGSRCQQVNCVVAGWIPTLVTLPCPTTTGMALESAE